PVERSCRRRSPPARWVGLGGHITQVTPPAGRAAWVSAVVVAVLRGRYVEGGVAVEEAVCPELEPDAGDRHHRPVRRAHTRGSGGGGTGGGGGRGGRGTGGVSPGGGAAAVHGGSPSPPGCWLG